MSELRDVEILRVGKWKGVPITQADLQEFARVNNSEEFPSVIGHPAKELKHLGKNIINSLRVVGDRLVQSVKNIPDFGMQAIAQGFLPNRSIKFHPKTKKIIHTGFLPAGVAPAVEGLAAVQFSELEEFEDESEDSQYIEFQIKEVNMDELQELKAQFVQFQAESQAKTEALELELAKVKANVAEKPTEFSALINQMADENKIFEWQKPFLAKLDPFKPVEFASDSDRTALIDDLKALSASWEIPIEFKATPKGEDMFEDDEDGEMAAAAKRKADKLKKNMES
jgi:hypothetical protein